MSERTFKGRAFSGGREPDGVPLTTPHLVAVPGAGTGATSAVTRHSR